MSTRIRQRGLCYFCRNFADIRMKSRLETHCRLEDRAQTRDWCTPKQAHPQAPKVGSKLHQKQRQFGDERSPQLSGWTHSSAGGTILGQLEEDMGRSRRSRCDFKILSGPQSLPVSASWPRDRRNFPSTCSHHSIRSPWAHSQWASRGGRTDAVSRDESFLPSCCLLSRMTLG